MSTALAKIDQPSQGYGLAGDQQDKLMGEQLTAEFKEAVGGMVHVVRVGAMVMMLRQRVLSTVGETAPSRGPTAKGKGLDSWLEKYAPDVARGTAYRFEDVTKAVAKSFELPRSVAKRLTFEQIVSADPKDLDEPARKVREQIDGFVAGTSQKSWLDQFKEPTDRGGARKRKGDKNYDPNSPAEIARDLWNPLMDKIEKEGLEEKSWKDLPTKDLNRLRELLTELRQALKAKA